MGTYTDFTGAIRITPCLKEPLAGRFRQFLDIRHMKRDGKILEALFPTLEERKAVTLFGDGDFGEDGAFFLPIHTRDLTRRICLHERYAEGLTDERDMNMTPGPCPSLYDDAFNKFFFVEEDKIYAFGPNGDRKSKLQTEESKALELVTDYPVKSWYPSFEAYCDEHRGFVKASDGRWGYTCNPNAKWDWWQIGGRFPNQFLVPAGLQDCIPSAKDDDGESAIPPEGYQYADAARKKDICWDVMRKIAVDTVEKRYQKCVKAFETKDLTDFGPLCRILDEGISAWGEMLYLKGETLDEYKARKGATDLDRYMCHTYAFVDRNGDWTGSGDMGWFGISSNDKDERAWNDEIQKLMNEAKDDDFLAIVDCHI